MVKDKIVEVSLERFLQYGIRSMTIKKLVEPLGISTKTVYKYFGSKEELLGECLRVLYEGYFNEFTITLGQKDSPVITLRNLFHGGLAKDFGVTHNFFHDLNYYYPELQNAALSRMRNNYNNLLMPLIETGIREGSFYKFIIPEMALKGIVILYTSITRSEEYKHDGNPYELFKNLVEVFIRGMCTEKGLKEIENNPYHNE
nr:TetR/AcrR family transcriptional regulator [Mucilaginibacter sp. L294]